MIIGRKLNLFLKNAPEKVFPFSISVAKSMPNCFARILEPKIRHGLFLSGAGLVLITCIFFGTR